MGLKLKTASNGSVSLEPTNTASDYTLTVPAQTGTVVATDASGNVGIGTTTSSWDSSTFKAIQVTSGLTLAAQPNTSSAKIGSNWYFNNGYKYVLSDAACRYDMDANTHKWFTAPSGTAGNDITFTERMRIDSSGNLLVGASSTNTGRVASKLYTQTNANQDTCQLSQSSNSYFNLYSYVTTSSGTRYHVGFCDATGGIGGVVGTISTNGSSTTYATTSDYRLKENIAPMTGALAKVAQLKPCTYTWKSTGEASQGFIAHELQEIVPDAVTGEKDATKTVDIKDEDGNVIGQETKPLYQGIDTSFLVATLTAAIQELKAVVDAQANTITAMEARLTVLEQA